MLQELVSLVVAKNKKVIGGLEIGWAMSVLCLGW